MCGTADEPSCLSLVGEARSLGLLPPGQRASAGPLASACPLRLH